MVIFVIIGWIMIEILCLICLLLIMAIYIKLNHQIIHTKDGFDQILININIFTFILPKIQGNHSNSKEYIGYWLVSFIDTLFFTIYIYCTILKMLLQLYIITVTTMITLVNVGAGDNNGKTIKNNNNSEPDSPITIILSNIIIPGVSN